MNKKIILSLSATALLASSLFGYGLSANIKQGCKQGTNQHKMMMRGSHHNNGGKIINMVMMLDLSAKQKTSIEDILAKSMNNMPSPHDAFTDTNFDKEKFISLVKQRRDGKIEHRAEVIAKVYAVLTPVQKKDLKTILDMKDMMRKKMMSHGGFGGQNCNGRR